jgi:nucleotide sugar dehydrogenase
LEKYSGLRPGEGFSLVFSPERVLTGRVFHDLRRYPKLIGGVDEGSTTAARQFYAAVLDFDERPDLPTANGVWDLGTSEAAELAKLAETTYRDVNIGLANQFALFAEQNGIDIHQVIAASNSQPYSHIHRPGVAVGGHCIPVYPRLYLWNDPSATVVSAARAANEAMPDAAIRSLEGMLGSLDGATVAVLGATYRSGVKETAFSGVFPLVAGLSKRGARPAVHDPLLSDAELVALGLEPYTFGERAEAVVVHTDHPEYAEIGIADVPGVRAVVDGRNVTRSEPWGDVPRRVLGVG